MGDMMIAVGRWCQSIDNHVHNDRFVCMWFFFVVGHAVGVHACAFDWWVRRGWVRGTTLCVFLVVKS